MPNYIRWLYMDYFTARGFEMSVSNYSGGGIIEEYEFFLTNSIEEPAKEWFSFVKKYVIKT